MKNNQAALLAAATFLALPNPGIGGSANPYDVTRVAEFFQKWLDDHETED